MILGLAGCKDDFDLNGNLEPSLSAYYLRPSETTFNSFSGAAFSKEFTVESFGTPWLFSDVVDWLTLTPSSGNATASVTLSVQENDDAENGRTSIFYLQSGDPDWSYNRAMSVSQEAATPSVSLDTTSLYFSGAASSQKVEVSANCIWSVQCFDNWVSLSPDVNSGILSVSVSANTLHTYRNSSIYINYGAGLSKIITVSQAPAEISSSASTLEYENAASKYDITINSESDWTAIVSDSWISVSPDHGDAGATSVSIEVTPNAAIASRNGYVAFYNGSNERLQIAIIQKGIYIEANENLAFTAARQSQPLHIHSNTDWTVTSKPNWLTLSKESGSGDDELTVTVEENPGTSSRSGEIVLSQPGLSIDYRVSVTQAGKSLSPDVTLLEFSDKEGQQTFNLVSDASWSSTQSADWFRATPSSGYGDATITVSVEANNTADERVGTILYNYGDQTASVNIHQMAKYLTVDNQSLQFVSKGGSHTIQLSTNEDWTAEIEQDTQWLKLSCTSGTGNSTIIITADDNASVNTRSATVIINPQYSQSIRILVSQKPRQLSVSTQSVMFFAAGGTSEVISIDCDGSFEIKSDSSWFTVNKESADTFTVYATKNTANEMRRGSIIISLTDLTEGSLSIKLPVIQAGEGASFIINGFTEDTDWDTTVNGTLSIAVKGYTSDKNWDNDAGSTITITVTGYSTEHDWNINNQSGNSLSINPYGVEKNLDNSSNSNATFNNMNYNSDSNWNE
ncbi:MAG: hypothetical protein K2H21_06125 [Muribaculaceae bacterium]|nr:hypothetical protein [Muribaculaceae bacterium]